MGDTKYLIKSLKWSKHYGVETWYKPDSNGYTHQISDAGIYTEDDKNEPNHMCVVAEKVIEFVPITEKLKQKGIKQLEILIKEYVRDVAKANDIIKDSMNQMDIIQAKINSFNQNFGK